MMGTLNGSQAWSPEDSEASSFFIVQIWSALMAAGTLRGMVATLSENFYWY
jgi:hypothetical protein